MGNLDAALKELAPFTSDASTKQYVLDKVGDAFRAYHGEREQEPAPEHKLEAGCVALNEDGDKVRVISICRGEALCEHIANKSVDAECVESLIVIEPATFAHTDFVRLVKPIYPGTEYGQVKYNDHFGRAIISFPSCDDLCVSLDDIVMVAKGEKGGE